MLQDRYETDKIFENILKHTNEMDPILAEIDRLLEDEVLYQMIRNDLAKRFPQTEVTGRNSTPVEVILRMLAVKRLYALSYEQTEYQVRDSLVLRQFCRVYLQDVPDDTTLIRWAALIQPETLEQFNSRLTELASQLKVARGRKLRTDGTVVETNIHPPSDSSLLADSVRVLGRTLSRARQVLGEQTELGKEVFRNRVRSPGYVMLDVDLERADLQIVTWEAGDEKLKEIIRSQENVHIENAKDIFGGNPVKSSAPDSPYHRAKQGVHATNYGAKPPTLARHLGITVHEAQKFQDRWFAAHPAIKDWQNRIEASLSATRTVRNKFGFFIRFFGRVDQLLPEALAWVPQSTVAVVINKGWNNVSNNLPWAEVLMQVHDSLVIQIPTDKISRRKEIRDQLLIEIPYDDPLVIPVECSMSRKSWGDCEPITWET